VSLGALVAGLGRGARWGAVAAAAAIEQFFRRRQALPVAAHQNRGDRFRAVLGQKGAGNGKRLLGRLFAPSGILHQTLAVARPDGLDAGRRGPGGFQVGRGQQALGLTAPGMRHQQNADTLAAGPAGAAAAMQKLFAPLGQVGMDDEAEVGQVDAAGGNVGGHAHPRPPVAQRLQRMRALRLAEFARQGHHGKAALEQLA
jgi:hypothetical protein